ncbi:MAG: hypothetical protein M3445_00510 [Actinomycetota bacterium]|nr:hypothetical protein [Actinomycetota bacterium]
MVDAVVHDSHGDGNDRVNRVEVYRQSVKPLPQLGEPVREQRIQEVRLAREVMGEGLLP